MSDDQIYLMLLETYNLVMSFVMIGATIMTIGIIGTLLYWFHHSATNNLK